jgi:hypothetical protein
MSIGAKMSQLLKDLREEQEHYKPFNFDRYERTKRIADHIAILEEALEEIVGCNVPGGQYGVFDIAADALKETK